MNLSNLSLVNLVVDLQNQNVSDLKIVDNFDCVLQELLDGCKGNEVRNETWLLFIEKCLKYEMPLVLKMNFEKILDASYRCSD